MLFCKNYYEFYYYFIFKEVLCFNSKFICMKNILTDLDNKKIMILGQFGNIL